jgi:hypothetical protein
VLFFRNWDGATPIVGNYRFIGEPGASLLYDELRRVARRYIRDDRAENKLQTMALVNEVYLRLLDVKNVDWKQTCRVALFWRVDRSGDCRSSEDLPANNPARLGVRQILANTGTEPVTAVEALLLTTDSGDGPYHYEYAWRLGSEIRMCRRNDVPSTTNRLIRPLLHQIFGIGPGKSQFGKSTSPVSACISPDSRKLARIP